MPNRILMIAYHYPPIQGSSGVHRTLSFSAALAAAGWAPSVLTVNRAALPEYRAENEAMIPPGVRVLRALALDATRHLTIQGKYLRASALPDRWMSWVPAALVTGLWEVLRHRPQVLYSTYPIATAHVIGYLLHRLTGLPWIADFRDPMAQDGYPTDLSQWRAFKRIEGWAIEHAARVIFTAPSALDYYRANYPGRLGERGVVIENGYDEALFASALTAPAPADTTCLRLLHAGVLYPQERDPRAFFAALRALKAAGKAVKGALEITLRGTGHDELYRPMLRDYGLEDIVTLAPPVGYRDALVEMLGADALLLFQAADCNFQIPAKTYEYIRARRPILAMTDPAGDSAQLLRAAGVDAIARLDSASEIEAMLARALEQLRAQRGHAFGDAAVVARCSRDARAHEFIALVEAVAQSGRGAA